MTTTRIQAHPAMTTTRWADPTMTTTRILRLSGALLLVLAASVGCVDRPTGFEIEATEFGNAVRHNIAAQAVNPEPQAAAPDAFDATRAGLAIARYRADKVEPPRELRTSEVGGDG